MSYAAIRRHFAAQGVGAKAVFAAKNLAEKGAIVPVSTGPEGRIYIRVDLVRGVLPEVKARPNTKPPEDADDHPIIQRRLDACHSRPVSTQAPRSVWDLATVPLPPVRHCE